MARWTPSARESLPNFKQVAADVVQGLCTRAPGQTVADVLELLGGSLSADFLLASSLAALAPLGEGTASTGEVLYPQFAGLAPLGPQARTGAAMVVVRQRMLGSGGAITTVTRTVDVRLRNEGGRWLLTAVPNGGGEPVARPAELPPAAVQVLDDPRIELPDTARWDVHARRIALPLLELLSSVAALAPLSVAVLATGHPAEVFGTARTSEHTVGRAVDVWRVGGTAVIDDRSPGGPTAQLQAAALGDARTSQVGSPPGTDLDGAGRRSFDDLVHEDHLHLAVRR